MHNVGSVGRKKRKVFDIIYMSMSIYVALGINR